MLLPATTDLVSADDELGMLVPHPLEIALAGHVLLVLVVLVVAVALAKTRGVRLGVVGWIGFAVLLLGPFPVVGPLAAALLVGLNLVPRQAGQSAPTM